MRAFGFRNSSFGIRFSGFGFGFEFRVSGCPVSRFQDFGVETLWAVILTPLISALCSASAIACAQASGLSKPALWLAHFQAATAQISLNGSNARLKFSFTGCRI